MIKLIFARDLNGGIGYGGDLPWHLPEDLQFFKKTTTNADVIMGRKCYQSIPDKFRPLPNRRNIVVTHNLSGEIAKTINSEGAVAVDMQGALEIIGQKEVDNEDIFVIGGAQIYCEFMPYADEIIVTEIDAEFIVDTYASPIPNDFHLYSQSNWQISEKSLPANLRYRMLYYKK